MAGQVFILMRREHDGGDTVVLRAYRNEEQAKSALALIKACHAPGLIEVIPVELEGHVPAVMPLHPGLPPYSHPLLTGGVGIAQAGQIMYQNGVTHKVNSNVLA